MNPHLSRRSALVGGGAALAAGLAACAPPNPGEVNAEPTIPAADGKVHLTYWAWLKDLQKVLELRNKAMSDLQGQLDNQRKAATAATAAAAAAGAAQIVEDRQIFGVG